MEHANALVIADELVRLFAPGCTRIEIAGSIRRGKPEVKDIEIVAIPDMTPMPRTRPTFGQAAPVIHKTKLDRLIFDLMLDGWIRPLKGGEKYKQFEISIPHGTLGSSGNVLLKEMEPIKINLDLFLVTPPAQWGVQLVLRTGPNSQSNNFSQWCVTPKAKGGGLPAGYMVDRGAVWQVKNGMLDYGPVSMPEEINFLDFLGLGWVEPGERVARWQVRQ